MERSTQPRRTSTRPMYGYPPGAVRLSPERAQELAPADAEAGDQLAYLGEARAQLRVPDLDRPHRVLQLCQLGVGGADRVERRVEEPLDPARRRAGGRRLEGAAGQ